MLYETRTATARTIDAIQVKRRNPQKQIRAEVQTVDLKVEGVNTNLGKAQEQIVDTIILVSDEILTEV